MDNNNLIIGAIGLTAATIGGYFWYKNSNPPVPPIPPIPPPSMNLLANTNYYVTYVGELAFATDVFGSAIDYYDQILYWNETLPTPAWQTVALNTVMLPNLHYAVRFTQPVTIYNFIEWTF